MGINRRDFLRNAASASAAAALVGAAGSSESVDATVSAQALPAPAKSGIEHIVVVMMENRSFDHYLGWMANANGRQAGLTYYDNNGAPHPTERLTDYIGCAHPDPDHSYAGGRSEYNHGRMDSWLRTGTNDDFSIGYYAQADMPFFSGLALNYTVMDNFFASILGPTFPNRVYSYAAQTDRLSNTIAISSLPTIFDRLKAAGVSTKYYYGNVPMLSLWGLKYLGISHIYPEFLLDAYLGRLSSVTFLDPAFTILDDGEGNDDHPHADIRAGEAFLGQVFSALTSSPAWDKTVLIVTRDEWGGFFDHVVPPRVISPNAIDTDLVNGRALLGCRVPVIIASPFTRGNPEHSRVSSLRCDHTSVLKFIEWRFGLAPLTKRDASNEIANLAHALDFASPDSRVPALSQVPPPIPTPCGTSGIFGNALGREEPGTARLVVPVAPDNESYDFHTLMKSERTQGWRICEKGSFK
jgi:phospholipase C